MFSGTVPQAFEANEEDVDFHGIFLEDLAVGFYKIDRRYQRSLPDPLHPHANRLGMRAFMIDQYHQGRGIATRAVAQLGQYLSPRYRDFTSVWLTVNLANLAAQSCYSKGGFQYTGELYHGGRAGAQSVMCLPLQSTMTRPKSHGSKRSGAMP